MTLPPTQGAVDSAIRRLRAECDAGSSDIRRAVLLHELAELEERFGDESAAARDQLAAVNAAPQFREPLERLLTLVQQRRSHRNRGRLLERLVTVAETPTDRLRALLEKAAHFADNEDDLVPAQNALEQAAELAPDDLTVWLALELLAGQLNEADLRMRALGERARHVTHPTWRALLLVDYAGLSAETGAVDVSLEALNEAIRLGSSATALALSAKAALGQTHEDWIVLGEALAEQARLIDEALKDAEVISKTGLPAHAVRREVAADLRTRAAHAYELGEQTALATELLSHSARELPDDVGVLTAELESAIRRRDESLSARLSRQLLKQGAAGPEAAILWLQVAEAHADTEPDVAIDALSQALHFDPDCSPARALELDLLSETGKLPRLARALSATAEHLPSSSAKLRFSLLAADVYARYCADGAQARAALGRSLGHDTHPQTLARLGRMYAAVTGDRAWFEEASTELARSDVSETERASLWLELGRSYARSGDIDKTLSVFRELSQAAESAWLGNVLLAYYPGSQRAPVPQALERLAELETDTETARALRVAQALRLLRSGSTDEARDKLFELHQGSPADATVASALSELERLRGQHSDAARVLEACARAGPQGQLSAALLLEAGILRWRAGERATALETFAVAADHAPRSAAGLLGWALRIVRPDDFAARARSLELTPGVDSGVGALDQIALRLAEPDPRAAGAPPPPENADDDVLDAYQLGCALFHAVRGEAAELLQVLTELSQRVPAARALARTAVFRTILAGTDFKAQDFSTLEQTARDAAVETPSLAASLEWLAALQLVRRTHQAASVGLRTPESEVQARRQIGTHLETTAAIEMAASAALAESILTGPPLPLLTGDHPAIRLTNLELALPGDEPERRAQALAGLGSELGEESQFLAQVLSGYNWLKSGNSKRALSIFRDCADSHPKEIVAWEGLKAAATELIDYPNEAYACAALGSLVSDNALGAELWERAGLLFLERLKDNAEAENAFAKAIDRNLSRHVAFDKLFRLVRARNVPKDLLRLIERGLTASDDPAEISKLYWEQARALRALRDSGGAWAALENVWMLEPDHVGALALAGELLISKGQFADAAGYLARLARLPEAPNKQRLIGGVAAIDLYEHKLENLEAALSVLLSLEEAGLATLPIRERLAKVAAKCGEWEHATRVLDYLAMERTSSEGRAEAARLGLVIYRDEIRDPNRAATVTQLLLAEVPDDIDGLDLVLGEPFDPATNRSLLELGKRALVTTLREQPVDPERLELLARIAQHQGDSILTQAALGAWVATTSTAGAARLDAVSTELLHTPEVRIDDTVLAAITDPEELDATHELLVALAPTIAEILGPDIDALGIARKHRITPRQGLPIMSEVAAWAGALGLGEFELYVGGNSVDAILVLASEPAKIVLGDAITAPLSPEHRARLARELFALRRGTSAVLRRPAAEVVALIVAACALGESPIKAPAYALLGEFERLLKNEMPRRVKKLLPELARAVAASNQEPTVWVSAARRTLDRAAAAAVGDVTWALASSGERGSIGATSAEHEEAKPLLAFLLSDEYARFRRALTTRLS